MTATGCPRCGAPLEPDAPQGLCPGCLLRSALEPPPLEPYELLGEVGRGGMGVIYKARQGSRVVALKMIGAAELAGGPERERFRAEIEAVSQLDHPNIVPIFHVGEAEGRPYFTMKLMEGGALADALDRYRGAGPAIARLLGAVARGVHHAHQRGILHRDLKPANVLLDAAGAPYVADFGMAKLMDRDLGVSQSAVVGTPGYIAPEQAVGDRRRITTAADVYSLGAILYELLVGRPPFEGQSAVEVFQKLLHTEPARPRTLDGRIHRDLETVCLKCLEKDPSRRYRSAEELADDLERFARGEPILARPLGALPKLWRATRRHPLAAAAAAGVTLLLLGVTGAALSVARSQEEDLRRDVLRMNAYAARALSGTVLFKLRELGDLVESAARDEQTVKLMEQAAAGAPSFPQAHQSLQRFGVGSSFDNVSLFDRSGIALARWPPPPREFVGSSFAFRDYFRGARCLAEQNRRGVYLARSYRSETDGSFKFGLSAPVYAADGSWLGVVSGVIGTDSALEQLRLQDPGETHRTAVLVGLRDNERHSAEGALPQQHYILLHEGLGHGEEISISSPWLDRLHALEDSKERCRPEQLRLSMGGPLEHYDDHRDPVPGFEGRWLAGLAPVGGTPYLIIVQTRYEAALQAHSVLLQRLAGWGGGALGVGLLTLGLALLLTHRLTSGRRR